MSMYSGGWQRALLQEGVGCRGESAITSVSSTPEDAAALVNPALAKKKERKKKKN